MAVFLTSDTIWPFSSLVRKWLTLCSERCESAMSLRSHGGDTIGLEMIQNYFPIRYSTLFSQYRYFINYFQRQNHVKSPLILYLLMVTPERPICTMKLGDPYIFGIVYSMQWFSKKQILISCTMCPERSKTL